MRDVDACALLTPADQAVLKVEPGKPKDDQTDMDKGCIWRSVDPGMYSVRVNAYGNLGHKDVVSSGGVKSLPDIGRHKAIQFSVDPICAVSFALTESSRVDVTGNTGNDVARSCEFANQAARIIEPKLPGGS